MPLLRITNTDNALWLEGEVDLSAEDDLTRALDAATKDGTTTVDLSGVTFMDSTGLRVLLRRAAVLNGSGPLALRAPPARVQRLLDVAFPTGAPGLVIER
jgi:anti-sigma B factor antagonist